MKKAILILALAAGIQIQEVLANGRVAFEISILDQGNFEVFVNNDRAFFANGVYYVDMLNSGYHRVSIEKRNGGGNNSLVFDGEVYADRGTLYLSYSSKNGLKIDSDNPRRPSRNPHYYGYGPANPNFISQPMLQSDFQNLLRVVSNSNMDSNRLMIAKNALRHQLVMSQQVAQLVDLLSFESNKLELAKFAYANTVDKGNYFLVFERFSFNSSSRELDRYISSF